MEGKTNFLLECAACLAEMEEKQSDKESYHRNCQRLSLGTWALVQDKIFSLLKRDPGKGG